MTLSLNEVEATAKRAARGAGYPWGLAEEAGKATRWLCSRDVDGCRALAKLLEQFDGEDITGWVPQTDSKTWTARDGTLCPVATGAAISDLAPEIAANGIRLEVVAAPALLAPFAALLANELQEPVVVTNGDFALCTDGARMSSTGPFPQSSPRASISLGGAIDQPSQIVYRADPDPSDWAALLAFAHTLMQSAERAEVFTLGTRLTRITGAGLRESHPHDVQVLRDE